MNHCHEFVHFSFRADVALDTQTQAMRGLSDWAKQQPGFVERQSFFDASAQRWIDHVIWQSEDAAKQALQQATRANEMAALMALIDEQTVVMGHYTRVV
jgi:hypothetical protein